MEPAAETAFVRNEDVLAETVQGEIVLLELGADRYFRLNGTGARLWHRLEQPRSTLTLASFLVSEHDIEEDRALVEVDAFLQALAERGLVRRVS